MNQVTIFLPASWDDFMREIVPGEIIDNVARQAFVVGGLSAWLQANGFTDVADELETLNVPKES